VLDLEDKDAVEKELAVKRPSQQNQSFELGLVKWCPHEANRNSIACTVRYLKSLINQSNFIY
jgi:hypothetical protein